MIGRGFNLRTFVESSGGMCIKAYSSASVPKMFPLQLGHKSVFGDSIVILSLLWLIFKFRIAYPLTKHKVRGISNGQNEATKDIGRYDG